MLVLRLLILIGSMNLVHLLIIDGIELIDTRN